MRFAIAARAPFPWPALLAYLDMRLIDGYERIADACYERRGEGYALRVRHDARRGALQVEAQGMTRAAARARVEPLFSPRHDGHAIDAALARDALLAPRIARCPGFRPLGCWSAFELCLRTVIGQQVTVAAARTLMARLLARCGEPTPARVAAANLDALGMPGARVAAIRAFAAAVAAGDIALDAAWPALNERLSRQPGFGPWTRAYLAIRLGRDADAFPDSDIGLLRAAGIATPKALRARAEAWRPYRGHAATLLWALAP
ncbi:AlkA N-terminal domain-containing protein [Solimonas soli]|uniref:DNA-3-methyladenine glycosylase family protein n=1 Tax=Solimonas soli TaxID=413479 RepID=UPI000483CA91